MEYKYLEKYILGFGKVGVLTGSVTYEKLNKDKDKETFPFINISYLKEDFPTNSDIPFDTEVENTVQLVFTSVESLEVLQRAIDNCREQFAKIGKKKFTKVINK